jgi:hypothetical protein
MITIGVLSLANLFKKNKVDFRTIPICLESENATDYQLLDKVAKSISIRYSQSTLNNEKPCM